MKSFKTYEKYPLDEFIIVLVVWGLAGVIISLVFDFSFMLTSITAFSTLMVGLFVDTKSISANEVVGIYNNINNKPMFNVNETRVWNGFFGIFRRFTDVYNYTDDPMTIFSQSIPTKDKEPRQFVSLYFDIFDKMRDPLAYEINAGTDDAETLIENYVRDQLQKWTRLYKLYELESYENITITDKVHEIKDDDNEDRKRKTIEIFNDLKNFMNRYGITLLDQPIQARNITVGSQEARDELGKRFFQEKTEDLKREKFNERVNFKYLASLCREIDNVSEDHFVKKAKEELKKSGEEFNGYDLSIVAVRLAEIQVPDKNLRRSLYNKAYENEETRQGIVKKTRVEGFNGANPLVDASKFM
jgi:hypothetical protein